MKPVKCTLYDLMLLYDAAAVRPATTMAEWELEQDARWSLVLRILRGLMAIQEQPDVIYDLFLSTEEIKSLLEWVDVFKMVPPARPIGLECVTRLGDALYGDEDESKAAEVITFPNAVEEALYGKPDQNAGADAA